MHHLVQATIRAREASSTPEQERIPPDETDAPAGSLPLVLRLLRADAPAGAYNDPRAWPRWAVLLPHALAATGHVGQQPGSAVSADVAWLLDEAGTYLQVQARLTEAKTLLERALAIAEAAYGPDHPEVAISLNNLALILRDLGLAEQARPLEERAEAIQEAWQSARSEES